MLLAETIEALAIRPEGTYLDATFGGGGHALAILGQLEGGRLVAFDADPAIDERAARVDRPGLVAVHTNFASAGEALDALGITHLDGALYDLGVSSMQLDEGERGFSFREDAPLDMRLDPTHGSTAYQLLLELEERELADVIFQYGEERAARRIARAIVARRPSVPQTTGELARLVSGVLHRKGVRERIHPATRTFQALRIAVNDELGAIERSLPQVIERLRPGARIAVIAFHSLEDRIIKTTFRDDPRLRVITRKPLVASDEEQHRNPRSRSAKLRVAERVEHVA